MLFVSVSAFFIGGFTDLIDILLHVLAAWTIVSIISGVVFAKRGNIISSSWIYDWQLFLGLLAP